MKLTAPKGTRDILPAEIFAWQHIERTFFDVCALFGFTEIRIPTFESTEVFQRGVGGTTDVVQKEMYTFLDKGDRSISLRPEGTAGVARSFIENGMNSLPFPVKLAYNITAFRYENVQKGRYREFHQLGLEAFGSPGPAIDAEIISLIAVFFQRLGISDSMLRINSIGCPGCRSAYNQRFKEYLTDRYDGLCRTCRDRFETNPLRIIDCKEAQCKALTLEAPLLADHLCDGCAVHFAQLQDILRSTGTAFSIDKHIVRGLDYYTRTVFEFVSEHVGTQGTICGGGRYDGLIDQFGGGAVPGIGFALGIERLLMELSARGIEFHPPTVPSIYLAGIGEAGDDAARKICLSLREAGIRAETDLMDRSLKARMKYAGKSGYTHLVLLGDEELTTGRIRVKVLADGSEADCAIEDLGAWMQGRQQTLRQDGE
jgi:histidyl-tRNA synthetase